MTLAIPEYAETVGISQLSAYPLEHHPNCIELIEEFASRGRKFEELSGVHFRTYDGIAIDKTGSEPVPIRVSSLSLYLTHNYLTNNALD